MREGERERGMEGGEGERERDERERSTTGKLLCFICYYVLNNYKLIGIVTFLVMQVTEKTWLASQKIEWWNESFHCNNKRRTRTQN